tara:strand:- start:9741 stop:10115 length:375 start_codon:yes stop_codon:yes gene_type:complete
MSIAQIKQLNLPEGKENMTAKDIMEANAIYHASTDLIYDEIVNRLMPMGENPETGLENFKTETLCLEMTERVQRMTMLMTLAQNAVMMGNAIFSAGNMFQLTHRELLDGYNLDNGTNITGSADI